MTRPTTSRTSIRRRRVLRGSVLATAVLAFAAPASASAKTYTGTASDPTGDASVPGLDITSLQARYRSSGDVTFILTTAGPIDGATNNATFVVVLGKGQCNQPVLSGGGILNLPTRGTAFLQKSAHKIGHPKKGTGKVTGNVFKVKVHSRAFKGLKPTCMTGALLNESNGTGTVIDKTDVVKLS